MKIIINQFFGLGDVIFCMTIARRWMAEGNEITWPVMPNFVEGLQRAFPDVQFVNYLDWKIDYENRNEHDVVLNGIRYRVIPLRWNVENMKVPYSQCMSSKYEYVGMDWKGWKELAMWERSKLREWEIYKTRHGGWKDKKFTLINRYFGSNSQFKVNIPATGIEMKSFDGYSLFDWAYLIENAEYIHVANSSILYLLELLDLQAKEIHLYCRLPQERDFKNTDYIHTKNYILHYD